VDRNRARPAPTDDRGAGRYDLRLSGGRHVAARCARRTARLQRHHGNLLLGAGGLSPGTGQARARRRQGCSAMKTWIGVGALVRARETQWRLAIAFAPLCCAVAVAACREAAGTTNVPAVAAVDAGANKDKAR